MESAFTYTALDVAPAREWLSFQMQTWGVDSPYVDWWVAEAARLLGGGRAARAVLEYEPDQRLLSFDVWCDGRRVYGMDDFV